MSNLVMQLIKKDTEDTGHKEILAGRYLDLNPQGLSVVNNLKCTLVKRQVSRKIRMRDKLAFANNQSFRFYLHSFLFCTGWESPKNWFRLIIKDLYPLTVQCKKWFLPPFLFFLGATLS